MGLLCSSLQPGCSSPGTPLCQDHPVPLLLASEPLEPCGTLGISAGPSAPGDTRLFLSISGGLRGSETLSDSLGWSVLLLSKEVPMMYQLWSWDLWVGGWSPQRVPGRRQEEGGGLELPIDTPSRLRPSWCICAGALKTLLHAPGASSDGRVGRGRRWRTV